MIAYLAHVHFAGGNAEPAVCAFVLFHLDAQKRDLIEKAVDGTERAEKAAEKTINKDTADKKDVEEGKLPGKEVAEHGEEVGISGMRQQSDRPFEGTRGANVFAKCGNGEHLRGKGERHGDDKHDQQDIFKIGKHPRDAALF